MRRLTRVVFLTAIWVLLWGEASVANVAGGALLAATLLVLYPPGRPTERGHPFVVRPLAVVHLVGYIVRQVVVANFSIARQILSRRANRPSAVVVYEFESESRRLITFVATVLAMSPGTMPVHVATDPALIAVHVLRFENPESVRDAIHRLEELTIRALSPRRPGGAVA